MSVICQFQKKVDNNGVRIHWKGSAYFILDKCTKLVSKDEYSEMSEPQVDYYCFFCFINDLAKT